MARSWWSITPKQYHRIPTSDQIETMIKCNKTRLLQIVSPHRRKQGHYAIQKVTKHFLSWVKCLVLVYHFRLIFLLASLHVGQRYLVIELPLLSDSIQYTLRPCFFELYHKSLHPNPNTWIDSFQVPYWETPLFSTGYSHMLQRVITQLG